MKSIVVIAILLGAHATSAAQALPIEQQSRQVLLTLADEDAAPLTVRATWERIAEGRWNLHQKYRKAFEYAPVEPFRDYAPSVFQPFLPRGPVAVGDVWRLDEARLDPILGQFHRGVTTQLRRGRSGAYACLRAVSERYAEISFRIHGEVELVSDEVYLTPGQFAGQLLIDRKQELVAGFRLYLPDRNTNADVNAYRFADIVYIPKMELMGGNASLRETIEWRTVLDEGEAAERLARRFYRFLNVDWADLETAIGRSRLEDKPLHVVILFGTLDDESC